MQSITDILNRFDQVPSEWLYAGGGFIFGALLVALIFTIKRQKLLTQNAELKAQIMAEKISIRKPLALRLILVLKPLPPKPCKRVTNNFYSLRKKN